MTNSEKLRAVFSEALAIDIERVVDELMYNTIDEWDSLAHMVLVADIESAFDIMLETEDIIDMSSFGKAKEILAGYDIEMES